jgi:hypothetical protein
MLRLLVVGRHAILVLRLVFAQLVAAAALELFLLTLFPRAVAVPFFVLRVVLHLKLHANHANHADGRVRAHHRAVGAHERAVLVAAAAAVLVGVAGGAQGSSGGGGGSGGGSSRAPSAADSRAHAAAAVFGLRLGEREGGFLVPAEKWRWGGAACSSAAGGGRVGVVGSHRRRVVVVLVGDWSFAQDRIWWVVGSLFCFCR